MLDFLGRSCGGGGVVTSLGWSIVVGRRSRFVCRRRVSGCSWRASAGRRACRRVKAGCCGPHRVGIHPGSTRGRGTSGGRRSRHIDRMGRSRVDMGMACRRCAGVGDGRGVSGGRGRSRVAWWSWWCVSASSPSRRRVCRCPSLSATVRRVEKDERVTIRVDAGALSAVRSLAETEQRSVSQMLRLLLSEALRTRMSTDPKGTHRG